MIRGMLAAALVAGMAAVAVAPAGADEPAADASELALTGDEGALDSTALEGVSGGTLTGSPTEQEAWRDADTHAYPIDIPGAVNPAGSGISHAATLGSEMGARPPGGDTLGSGAVAGDVADILW